MERGQIWRVGNAWATQASQIGRFAEKRHPDPRDLDCEPKSGRCQQGPQRRSVIPCEFGEASSKGKSRNLLFELGICHLGTSFEICRGSNWGVFLQIRVPSLISSSISFSIFYPRYRNPIRSLSQLLLGSFILVDLDRPLQNRALYKPLPE
jgi:hypothetical protein